MGTVFLFLTLMVVVIEINSRVMQCFPDPYVDLNKKASPKRIPEEVAIAIAIAKAYSQEAGK
jgi:Na+-transporting methylmalonyl-CoA/oxaloacetate decarboxylase gamma subunit